MATSACSRSHWSAVRYKTGSLAKAELFFIRDKEWKEDNIIRLSARHKILHKAERGIKREGEGEKRNGQWKGLWAVWITTGNGHLLLKGLLALLAPLTSATLSCQSGGVRTKCQKDRVMRACVCVFTFDNWKWFFSPLKAQFVWCFLVIKRLNGEIDDNYLH